MRPAPNRRALLLSALAALALLPSRPAQALGEETFGNMPLSDANYKAWPGVMTVVNHSSRVYHTWVNGNEDFYYQGDVAVLNDWLRRYATVGVETREVVLRPDPGLAHSFDRSKEIKFGWRMNLMGGIAKHLTSMEGGKLVWQDHPVVWIHVAPDLDLAKLEVPKGLRLVSLTEVKRRTREGLKSTDKTVRGWGAGVLASLDRFDSTSRETITGLLSDPDNWVKLNAVGALQHMGRAAAPALPQLKEVAKSDDKQLRERAEEAVKALELPGQEAAHALELAAHHKAQQRIEKFLATQKQGG